MCLRDTEVGRLQVQQYPGILPLSFVTLGILVLSCILHLNSFGRNRWPEITARSQRKEKLLIPGSTYEILVNDSDCPGLGHIATSWLITVTKKIDKPWSCVPSEGARQTGFCQDSTTRATWGKEGSLTPRKSLVLLPDLSGLSQEVRARTWFSGGGSCACSTLPWCIPGAVFGSKCPNLSVTECFLKVTLECSKIHSLVEWQSLRLNTCTTRPVFIATSHSTLCPCSEGGTAFSLLQSH